MFENVRLSPAFLFRPSGPPPTRGKGSSYCFLLLGCGGRWRVWADVGIGPYETVEAPTCTANRIAARIPLPPLRGTFPPGEGFVLLLPSVEVRWYAVGLGRCGHRPLRNGGGTYLYRKSDFRPHSSSAPTYSLLPITSNSPPRGVPMGAIIPSPFGKVGRILVAFLAQELPRSGLGMEKAAADVISRRYFLSGLPVGSPDGYFFLL